MLDAAFALLGGLFLAGVGGELFVRGVVGVARWARVPAGIVAVSIAAFATSSPELSVSVTAALAGTPQIGLGDAVGSNVVNVAFILGLALLLGEMRVAWVSVRRDFFFTLLTPMFTAGLLLDGEISRLEGGVMLCVFLAWLTFVLRDAWKSRSAAGAVLGEQRHWLAAVTSLVGLTMLVLAGRLIVYGASSIGAALGLAPFVIGATMVAIGTSVPELATTLISRWRGHEDVGIGTVLGSNMFNGLLIVGIVAVIHPVRLDGTEVLVGLVFGTATVAMLFPIAGGKIARWRGLLLVATYVGFVVLQLLTHHG